MKIAIVGFGRMGQIINEIALSKNHDTVIFDPLSKQADFKEVNSENLKGIDVGIDFTNPDVVLNNINIFIENKVKLIVGTSGWYDSLEEVREKTLKNNSSLLYGSNFSIGVNLFLKISEHAAKLINNFPDFDIAGCEVHHNQKVDSPSGTAISLANLLLENIDRKTSLNFDRINRKPEDSELHFASIRCGHEPGSHEVMLDSEAESISIKVNARNRRGYAVGSVIAAEWLHQNKGFFNFFDIIDQI